MSMMYEGKNIHYSSTDSKLLCSFSGKLCNQRRLNGYGFCVRHILEDPTAPFKRCAYVAKSSNQMCTQAIPKNEDRRYCNNHMQVLGMLPKKERKKKDKLGLASSPESALLLPNGGTTIMKPKFSLSISKDSPSRSVQPSSSVGELDDPYAFPDTAPSDNKPGGLASLSASIDSVLGKSLQSGTGFVRSASDVSASSATLGMSGGSMIAKYYPELAEKLEKMRAKPEPKASPKSRTKSLRTMNKLQNKIAQNKINEKLRKSQELNQTDSNSSPVQLSSPEAGVIVDQSPGSSPAFSPNISNLRFSPQSSTGYYQSSAVLTGYEQGQKSPDIPPLPQVDTSLLATLASQDNMGFQTTEVECTVNASNRLLPPHTPPRLPPPPYPGSSVLSQPSPITPSNVPSDAFTPRNVQGNPVMDSLSSGLPTRHQLLSTTASRTSLTTSVSSLPFSPPTTNQHLSKIATPLFLSPTSTNPALTFSSALTSNSMDHHHTSTNHVKTVPNHLPTLATATNMDIFSLLNINRKPLVVDTSSASQVGAIPSPNTVAAQLSLPPPPPYVPPKVTSSSSLPSSSSTSNTSVQIPTSRVKHSVRTVMTTTTPSTTPSSSVPHIKLRRVKGILSEKEALAKLKSESAMKFYSFYAKQKISNHSLVGPYLCSSDEDSADEDAEMLPWQPDIFSASSDDDEDDEDDGFNTNVPMSMRPTKLSLMKTRLRRQWHQAHQAFRSNLTVSKNHNQATLALIQTVRENGACAMRTLWRIRHIKKSKKKLRKLLPKKKKTCCHKSSPDGPCTNPCLPYTNHCLRHIMYNIDQQIFDYCTAKFADNTQCCMPVFDIRHELPLCPVHAAKADNYQKQMEAENKKKPRKKSKPAALTRPPRKGKKKKKGRYARPQKPLPESAGLDSTLSDVDVLSLDTPSSQSQETEEMGASSNNSASNTTVDVVTVLNPSQSSSSLLTPSPSVSTPLLSSTTSDVKSAVASSLALPITTISTTASLSSSSSSNIKTRTSSVATQQMDQTMELEETFSPDFDRQLELPLEQASRLLEESDFQEVVNKMPFEALDLFGKHGEADQEDGDQVPLDQASATKARDAIEKLLCGAMSEEESMQLAMVLAQNLHTDAELAVAGDGTSGVVESMDVSSSRGAMVADINPMAGISGNASSSVCAMDIQEDLIIHGPTNVTLSSQHLQRQQQQQLQKQLGSSGTHGTGPSSTSLLGSASSTKMGQAGLNPNSPLFKPPPPHQNHLQQQQLHHHHNTSITSATTSVKMTLSSVSNPSFHLNSAPVPFMDRLHPPSSAGLNLVYGQLESLSQSQMSVNQSHSHPTQMGQTPSSFSTLAKTVIRHLPTETQPTQIRSMTLSPGLRLASSSSSVFQSVDTTTAKNVTISSTPLTGKDSSGLTLGGAPNRNIDFSLQRELRLDRTGNHLVSNVIQTSSSLSSPSSVTTTTISTSSASSSSISSSSTSVLPSSLALPSIAKKAKLMKSSSPLVRHQIQQMEQSLQIKKLKQLKQQQQSPSQTHLQHHLMTSPPQPNLSLTAATDPSNMGTSLTPPLMLKSDTMDLHKLPRPEMHSLKPRIDPSPHKNILGPKSLPGSGSPKLKLSSPKQSLPDMTNISGKLSLPVTKTLSSSIPPSSSVLILAQDSPVYKAMASVSPSTKPSNTVRYTLTPGSSNNNPFASSIQKSIFSDPLGSSSLANDESPSESISVTVRHPSSLEAVPTTVRHTLPDTFPSHDSLPSSPLQLLPKSSSSLNSPTRSSSSSPSSTSSSPHRLTLDANPKQYASAVIPSSLASSQPPSNSELNSALSSQLASSRSLWIQNPSHHQQISVHGCLTNGGIPSYTKSNPKSNTGNTHQINSKLNLSTSPVLSRSSVKQHHPRPHQPSTPNKQHHPSPLGSTPGVPVACSSPATLPGFAPPLPTAAFKTTGTS